MDAHRVPRIKFSIESILYDSSGSDGLSECSSLSPTSPKPYSPSITPDSRYPMASVFNRPDGATQRSAAHAIGHATTFPGIQTAFNFSYPFLLQLAALQSPSYQSRYPSYSTDAMACHFTAATRTPPATVYLIDSGNTAAPALYNAGANIKRGSSTTMNCK